MFVGVIVCNISVVFWDTVYIVASFVLWHCRCVCVGTEGQKPVQGTRRSDVKCERWRNKIIYWSAASLRRSQGDEWWLDINPLTGRGVNWLHLAIQV